MPKLGEILNDVYDAANNRLNTSGGGTTQNSTILQNEMINTSKIDPFFLSAISSGTISTQAAETNHPGIFRISTSTTSNSGYRVGGASPYAIYLLSEGMVFNGVIRPLVNTDTTIQVGFSDTTTVSPPTDGAYIEVANGTATGKTYSNSTGSTTSTSQALTLNTWYHLRVTIGASASSVTFSIYTDDGTQIWTDSLSTNIPNTTGRETSHQFIATNSGTTSQAIADLDYMGITLAIQRGGA